MQTQSSIERLLKLNPPPGIDPESWADLLQIDADRRDEHEEHIQFLRQQRLWLIEKKSATRMAKSED